MKLSNTFEILPKWRKFTKSGHTASICQNVNVFCNFLVSLPSKFYNIYARYEIFSLNRIFESLDVIRVKIRFFAKKLPVLLLLLFITSPRPGQTTGKIIQRFFLFQSEKILPNECA